MHDYACMQCRRTPHARRKKRITMASVAKAPLHTTLLFAALALSAAPAIDFAGLPLPPECAAYPEVVTGLRAEKLYLGAYARHELHKTPDAPGGSRLVLPVEQRRVPISRGYAAHFEHAKGKLHEPDFFPLDARLRAKALPGDVIAAIRWSLAQGTALEEARDARTRRITALLERLRGCSMVLRRRQPKHVAHISSRVNVAGIAAAIDATDYPGRHVAQGFVDGFSMWPITNTRVYRTVVPNLTPAEAEVAQQRLLDDSEALTARTVDRVRTSGVLAGPTSDAVTGVLEGTAKELKAGLIRGPYTLKQLRTKCPNGALAMPRFGKPEIKDGEMSVRCIECAPRHRSHTLPRTRDRPANHPVCGAVTGPLWGHMVPPASKRR